MDVVSVWADQYAGAVDRTGGISVVVVKSDNTLQTATITVTQQRVIPYLQVSSMEIRPYAAGGTYTFTITNWNLNDYPNDILVSTSDSSWITVPNGGFKQGSFTLTVAPNQGVARSGQVMVRTVAADGYAQHVDLTVTQAAPIPDLAYTISPNNPGDISEGRIAAPGGNVTVNFTNYNAQDYTSITVDSPDKDWVTFAPTVTGASHTITAAPYTDTRDPRFATIEYEITKRDGTTQNLTITVVQTRYIPDLQLTTTPENATLGAAGGTVTINFGAYASDAFFSILPSTTDNWLTIPQKPYLGDVRIEVGVTAYAGQGNRTGTVTITVNKSDGTQQVSTVNITQYPVNMLTLADLTPQAPLAFYPDAQNPTAITSSQPQTITMATIALPDGYTLTGDPTSNVSWIRFLAAYNTSTGSFFTFRLDAPGTQDRDGIITANVRLPNGAVQALQIPIHQEGYAPDLTLNDLVLRSFTLLDNPVRLQISTDGGSLANTSIDLPEGYTYSALPTDDADWTQDPRLANNNSRFEFLVTRNRPTQNGDIPRYTTIALPITKPDGNSQTLTVTVYQLPEDLNLDLNEMTLTGGLNVENAPEGLLFNHNNNAVNGATITLPFGYTFASVPTETASWFTGNALSNGNRTFSFNLSAYTGAQRNTALQMVINKPDGTTQSFTNIRFRQGN
jgi:hypothetical protein